MDDFEVDPECRDDPVLVGEASLLCGLPGTVGGTSVNAGGGVSLRRLLLDVLDQVLPSEVGGDDSGDESSGFRGDE